MSILRTYLLGFGSARWLPREGFEKPETDPYIRVRNLFNPFVPLTDAIKWLIDFKMTRQIKNYQKVESVLARLLLLELGTRFPLREGVIYKQLPDHTIAKSERLDQLSDGNQTVLAIAVAIMEMLGELWNWEMEAAEGLVLLDEIGAHLHPRWKLRIVESLRSAFPRMQFLATTHEPLCLRGLYNQEVVVMQKTLKNKIIAIEDGLPSIEGMRVDQLLTSEYFGLDSTLDPEINEMFNRYYWLLSLRERMGSEEEELKSLKIQLRELDLMGDTRRERIMLEAIDQALANDAEIDLEEVGRLDDEIQGIMRDMWAKLERQEDI